MYRITKFGFFIVTSALLATAPAFADGLVFDPESYPQTVDIVAASSTNTSLITNQNTNPLFSKQLNQQLHQTLRIAI